MKNGISNVIPVPGRCAFLMTQTAAEDGRLCSRLLLREYDTTCSLTDEQADFDLLCAASDADAVYAAAGVYENGCRRVVLYTVKAPDDVRETTLLAPGKYASLAMCLHEGRLYLAAEELDGSYEQIRVLCIDPADGTVERTLIPTRQERACKPALASASGHLFLAYESFYGERYHLMTRVLLERRFSEAVEAGFDTLNDNEPSLYSDGTCAYLCWENSSPLFDDYVWQPPQPEEPTVYMPAYGHGWRVYSRIGLRRLHVEDGLLHIDTLGSDWNASPAMEDANESAGEAVCMIHQGSFYLLYAQSYGPIYGQYQAMVCRWEKDRFVRFNTDNIFIYNRKTPAWTIRDGQLLVQSETDDYVRSDCLMALPQTGSLPPFCPGKVFKLRTLRGTPGYTAPRRETMTLDGQTLNLYWGDLHMHSNISRCSRHPAFHCTNVEEKLRFSRDAGALDFCLLTDHEDMDDLEWANTATQAHFWNQDRAFTAFLGYEWTSTMMTKFHNYGHYNVLYRKDGPLRRIKDGTFDDLQKLWAALEPGQVLTIPHHPAEGLHTLDWDYDHPEFERLVEMFQVRGSYEYEGCDFDPRNYGRGIKPGHFIQDGLNRGYRFGFTCGGEHEGVGLTGVFAADQTRDAIFDALYARRTYGTTSVKLYATMFADDFFMGSDIPVKKETVTVHGTVHGTDDIASITLVTDLGETDLTGSYCPDTGDYRMDVRPGGARWMYVRIKQADGNMAWLSPVFFA